MRPAFLSLSIFLTVLFSVLPRAVADEVVRIMAANTTSGNGQSYDPGEGIRIFQGLQPDVVLIQEFNYGNDSASDFRDFVDLAFGTEFDYYREGGNEQIPNGVISRYPIIMAGEWIDSEVSNRDFAWAVIDIPGDRDLWAVSVHLLTANPSRRNAQANLLVNYIQSQVPATDYVVVAGDFNLDDFGEPALTTLSAVVDVSGRADDQFGATGTNASRRKPYDQVFPGSDLDALETPVVIAGHGFTYEEGLVFDSRVFTPLSAVSPVQAGDSGVSGMQHMAVIRDYLIPTVGGENEPSAYPTDFAAVATAGAIELSWTDVAVAPEPDGYLVKASTSASISAPLDGVDVTEDGDLSDGSAQVIVEQGAELLTFGGLPFDTTYYFKIFPFTDAGAIDYKTDGVVPAVDASTPPEGGGSPDAPVLGLACFPYGNGFTMTWAKVDGATGYRVDVSESATFSGGGGAMLIDEDFDASNSVPAGWIDGGTADDSLASHYSSAANCRALGSGDTLETPAVDQPGMLRFYVDSSGGGNGQTASISYSISGGSWQALGAFTVDTDGAVEEFDLTSSPDLSGESGVRFRFESGFNTWYLDDVVVEASGGAAFVDGYDDLAVGDVSKLDVVGLEPDSTYYFRVRAENGVGSGDDSEVGMVMTRGGGTAFSEWASDSGITPVDGESDFDGDLLEDFGEYAFGTDPTLVGTQGDWIDYELVDGGLRVTHRRSKAPGVLWEYFGGEDLQLGGLLLSEGSGVGEYEVVSVVGFGAYEEVTLEVATGDVGRYFFWIRVGEMP